ncbi:outer membrane protein assembly factor BamE [Comamonas flocculans]|uniref:Outer membrane protein assembly factor BamE n=1 Tax=Comamonas flocculans TaxID=2597701 RepID=A0A5B8RYA0_9BURK|nr:outer membrane protein assembly factor BamE [Comamonas flocculans]QEA14559.1 outer membrane protein assembly factor BamE [Comamonas flocculans]
MALLTALAGTCIALAACDQQSLAELHEGVSTEADVRARFGEPERIWPEADGARTFEYNRQPEGHVNYMITLAPGGTLRQTRQVLVPENFARVQPGADMLGVRRLLGQPARKVTYELTRETDWDWKWLDGPTRAMVFTATFGPDGRVRRAGSHEDLPSAQ